MKTSKELKETCVFLAKSRELCNILTDFYKGLEGCGNCPFYKTKEEFVAGLKKYGAHYGQ